MIGLFDEPTVAYARVAVERGVDRYPDGLTYGIPKNFEAVHAGQLVTVPLGRGNTPTSAWVLEVTQQCKDLPSGTQAKQILRSSSDAISLPLDLLELARWMSSYYFTPIGLTLSTMLPGPVRQRTGLVTRRLVDLPENLPSNESITPKQQHVLDVLTSMGESDRPIEPSVLALKAEIGSQSPIQSLIKKGCIVEHRVTRVEANWFRLSKNHHVPDKLTAEQEKIILDISNELWNGYSSHLLFGVTGSGKTEVYIKLIEKAIQDGGTALVLVPEISLTPQTAARLTGRFPDKRIAILHSALTKSQRHQQWALIANGEADIVLGVRSAVFAPIPEGQLRLIIVDEEHDSSFKQDQAPRYHGRDVAIRRAWMSRCPVLLGSATPSLESWWNATKRHISTLHTMSHRAPGLVEPKIELIDMRNEHQAEEIGNPIFSHRLLKAIQTTIAQNGQVLLLLNRRGFAPWIACCSRNCRWMLQCEHCDTSMVYHRKKPLEEVGFVRCHHCHTEQRLPKTCPDCGKKVILLGAGTQRVEAMLRETLQLPESHIARLDGDTRKKSSDLHACLERFERGEIKILLGTQMIAKGLDFPNVRLVGVINADTSIDLPDFRASERTYQLVSQVCGRCGRSEGESIALVQTFSPDAPAISLASQGLFVQFAESEIALRQASQLPPATRMVRFVIRDHVLDHALGKAESLQERLLSVQCPDVSISKPAPCVIPRIADQFRFECIVVSQTSKSLQSFLQQVRPLVNAGREIAVDVDPISLL